jgi:hypothetical protein
MSDQEFIGIDAINAMTREELAVNLRTVDSIVAENTKLREQFSDFTSKAKSEVDYWSGQVTALRAEIEKWKACRVHDVDEKEWLREQMIALRAVLREFVERYRTYRGSDPGWDCELEDRARALLAEGKA